MNEDLWRALLVNWLFWSGVTVGGIALVAILDLSRATWVSALQSGVIRLRRFLPVSAITLVALSMRAPAIPVRSVFAVVIAYAAAFWFCRSAESTRGRSRRPAAIFTIVYVAAFTSVARDVITLVQANSVNSLLPAYVVVTNICAGAAVLLLGWGRHDVTATGRHLFRDAGRTLVGWSLVCLYLLWSQFLVIWYGNLPDEVGFLTARDNDLSTFLAALAAVLRFGPVLALLVMAPMWRRTPLGIVAIASLAGFWIECWLLVAPVTASTPSLVLFAVTAASAVVYLASLGGGAKAPPLRNTTQHGI